MGNKVISINSLNKYNKMKEKSIIFASVLFILMGCTGEKATTESLINIDVTLNYPKKELILQDFMDVEYIPLETNDEFITKGKVMDVGKDIILVANAREGDILLFDRKTGKSLKKINHRGQSGEEYLLLVNLLLDEANGEMFANDGPSSKIQVYDLDGNYKRSISYKKGAFVSNIFNYDKNYLLCQDTYAPANEGSVNTFFLMSKQDGNMKDIKIPFEKKISTVIVKQIGDQVFGDGPRNSLIVPFQNNWILTEPSADTVYMSRLDNSLQPFMVRTPSVHTMQPEVFLFPGVLTDRYYFMQTVKKECDFEKNEGMPTTDLMYDKQENKIFKYVVNNKDFNERTEDMSSRSTNNEIVLCVTLQANELVEANGKGKLAGKLKELTSKLNEEDNPVIMLVKHKK
jgi:6-bladed beta-propeller